MRFIGKTLFKNLNILYKVDILKKRKSSVRKRAWRIFIVLTIIWIIGVFMFNTYQNIEIDNSNYVVTKVQSTVFEQTVEKQEDNSKKTGEIYGREAD